MAATAVDYHSDWSRKLRVTGARVSEVVYRPYHICPMHWHEFPSIGIVLKGQVSKRFVDSSVVIEANSAFTLPAGIMHTDDFGPGSRTVMIEVDPDHPLSIQRLKVYGWIFDRYHTVEEEQIRWLGRRLASALHRPQDMATATVDSLVGDLLEAVASATTSPPNTVLPGWLIEARQIALKEINRRVSVQEIAEQVGVHPAYLARRFRAEFGVTPGTFARNARLDWAASKLIETEAPIAELAIQAGFSDQSHFTRAFRRYFEQTPAQYRDNYRYNGKSRL